MARDSGSRSSKRRKKPAYPKPGTGEDYPARRPGTRVGETRSGQKIMQSTRATQARRAEASKKAPFPAEPLQPSRGNRRIRPLQTWTGGEPNGKKKWPFSTGINDKPTREDPWRL